MAKKKTLSSPAVPSARAEDQPATRRMLSLVRDELKSEIRALDRKMDARFEEQNSRFSGLEARFSRMELLLEEQNANNRIVLEGLQGLWQKYDQLEQRLP